MDDGQYSTDDYKFFKINIGAIIKHPVMLTFSPDCLKTFSFKNDLQKCR